MDAIKPGAIIVKKWGYDQTNVDFFLVLKSHAKSVTMVAVKTEIVDGDGWTGKVVPTRIVVGDSFRKGVKVDSSGEPWIRMTYGTGRVWNGKSSYYSATA